MAFKDLNLEQRLVAVHTDMLRHADFCLFGAVSQVGKVVVAPGVKTAGTDGADVYYDPEFCTPMSRKQLRYLVSHEQGHKMLRHCTDYLPLKKKYPREFAMAIDFVVNGQLEQMDKKFGTADAFLERPTAVPPLVSKKYFDASVPEVIRDLLQNGMPQDCPQSGQPGDGKPGVLDEHMDPQGGGEEATPEEVAAGKEMAEKVAQAVLQGEILQKQLQQLAGNQPGNSMLSGFRERKTDWRGPLRRFVQEIAEGDEQSRFSPPNKRFLPLGFIMPSHFSEVMDELIVACDTSGSMGGVYPIVFGEIANICKSVSPKRVRVIWWDTQVAGEQVFEPKDYDKIRDMMKPKGGGGTTVSCVAQHIKQKGYKPKATIYLTDGMVESSYEVAPGHVLWGVVGGYGFTPPRGKVLRIEED